MPPLFLPRSRRFLSFIGSFTLVVFFSTTATADIVTGQWVSSTGGTWGNASNWSSPIAPNGVGHEATLPEVDTGTSTRTIELDSDVVLGTLVMERSGHAYEIVSGGTQRLIFENEQGPARLDIRSQLGERNLAVRSLVEMRSDLSIATGSSNQFSFLEGGLDNSQGHTLNVDGFLRFALSGPQTHGVGARLILDGTQLEVRSNLGAGGANLAVTVRGGDLRLGYFDPENLGQDLRSIVVQGGKLRPHTTMSVTEGIRLEGGVLEGVRTELNSSLTNVGGRFETNNSNFVLTGDFVQESLGTLVFQFSDRGPQYPLHVNGNVTLGGTLDLDYLRYTPSLGDQFTLIQVADDFSINGEFDAFPGRVINGDLRWRVDYSPSAVSITAVPEPGSLALLVGLALLGVTATRLRRKAGWGWN